MIKKYFSTIMMIIAFMFFIVPNIIVSWPLSGYAGKLLISIAIIWPMWILIMGMKEAEISKLQEWQDKVLKIVYGDRNTHDKD